MKEELTGSAKGPGRKRERKREKSWMLLVLFGEEWRREWLRGRELIWNVEMLMAQPNEA